LSLGVRVIFILCIIGSIFHSRERRSVPGVDDQAVKAGLQTNIQMRPIPLFYSSKHHNITNMRKIQSNANSFIVKPGPTSASAPLRLIRLRFLINRLH
jgi:hypothetical protein